MAISKGSRPMSPIGNLPARRCSWASNQQSSARSPCSIACVANVEARGPTKAIFSSSQPFSRGISGLVAYLLIAFLWIVAAFVAIADQIFSSSLLVGHKPAILLLVADVLANSVAFAVWFHTVTVYLHRRAVKVSSRALEVGCWLTRRWDSSSRPP